MLYVEAVAPEISDKAITLVKNKQELLPINPEKNKRVLLVEPKGYEGGFGKLFALMNGKQKRRLKYY